MGKLSERAWGILEDAEGAIETHEVRTDQLQHMITAREGLKLLKSLCERRLQNPYTSVQVYSKDSH